MSGLSFLRQVTNYGAYTLKIKGLSHRPRIRMAHMLAGESVGVLIPKEEVIDFIVRCMVRAGCSRPHAIALADTLTEGDYRGHFSHGLNRLEMYIRDIQSGITVSDAEPKIVNETPAIALVDGMNCLGPVVGNFCMEKAIEKAKTMGVGVVAARNSNHYGIAGWYGLLALHEGLIGISSTNTSPLVVPSRSRQPALGTNPLAFFAPGKDGDSFELDMATSAVALGKVEMSARKEAEIPLGWGVDEKGDATTDPSKVMDGGGLCPLGGVEMTGGYKGYGLAMMMETLCGVLAGASFGTDIRGWKTTSTVANLGQFFMAIDPNAFSGGFEGRMSALNEQMRTREKAAGETGEILIAGDPEKAHMEKCRTEGGIRYHPNLIASMNELAAKMDVEPMRPK